MLGKDFKPSVKELNVPKSTFFHCEEYMKVKIMSRVLVGFGETADHRGRTPDADADGHGFFERLLHKSPKGANIFSKDPNTRQLSL